MRALLLAFSAATLLQATLPAQGQRIKVAVSINDTTRQLPAGFSAAFRQLGDIDVVDITEKPDFVLSGVALCNPTCEHLGSYAISLRFYSPFPDYSVDGLTTRIANVANVPWGPVRDSIRAILSRRLSYVEVTHGTWVATWGRNLYEQKIREFARELDYTCFDRERALARAAVSNDSTAWRTYEAFSASRKWLC